MTGASGQLGRELGYRCRTAGYQLVAADREELDICNTHNVREFIAAESPDIVFNAAAWTAVDDAETHFDEALRTNRDGAENLAIACADRSILLVHYSTDYVFDGQKESAYTEADEANPINAYGRSKLAGEEAVRAVAERHLIFRTSWVFSAHGSNFVKSMLRLGSERRDLKVVSDQVGKPTSAAAVADVSLSIAIRDEASSGTFHLAQPEAVSWHDFALAIFDSAAQQGCKLAIRDVAAISSSDFPTVAARPRNSVLDCRRLEERFQIAIPGWRGALDLVIGELISDGFPA